MIVAGYEDEEFGVNVGVTMIPLFLDDHQYTSYPQITIVSNFEDDTLFRDVISFVTTTPASKSLCPPRYFVAECMTKSTPHLNGSINGGGANVASTATTAPN